MDRQLNPTEIPFIGNELVFPDPRRGNFYGIIAVGGDLSTERLLLAYRHGIFPWFAFREGLIKWHCPLERFVIYPDEIHISHSMRSLLRKNLYTVSIDKDFDGVISNCSKPRIDEEGAWLGPDMIQAYTELHKQGFAHSVEVWDKEGKLVGGLYGVVMGSIFIGESMFSLAPSGSKIALIALARTMKNIGGDFIDCQMPTDHLESMGGRIISYDEYMEVMDRSFVEQDEEKEQEKG